MKYISNVPEHDWIGTIRSPGEGKEVELTEAQAEQPLRKGYISLPVTEAEADTEKQVAAKKK